LDYSRVGFGGAQQLFKFVFGVRAEKKYVPRHFACPHSAPPGCTNKNRPELCSRARRWCGQDVWGVGHGQFVERGLIQRHRLFGGHDLIGQSPIVTAGGGWLGANHKTKIILELRTINLTFLSCSFSVLKNGKSQRTPA
jgi:hypothetical protein